jgi:hypothetical protein
LTTVFEIGFERNLTILGDSKEDESLNIDECRRSGCITRNKVIFNSSGYFGGPKKARKISNLHLFSKNRGNCYRLFTVEMSIPTSEDASAYEGAMKKRDRSFQKQSISNNPSVDETAAKVNVIQMEN